MGFRAQSTLITLEFEDPALKGLEVKVRSVNFGQLQELMELAELAGGESTVKATIEAMNLLTDRFVSHVMGWNLEHEVMTAKSGERPRTVDVVYEWAPTPISVEGLKAHEPDLVMSMIFTWVNSMTGVSAGSELGKASSSGSSSVEESIPMDVSLESPTSFDRPSLSSISASDSAAFPAS